MKMKVELSKQDFELIYQSLCYFDHFEEYSEWFDDTDKANRSFHYLYSLSQKYRK